MSNNNNTEPKAPSADQTHAPASAPTRAPDGEKDGKDAAKYPVVSPETGETSPGKLDKHVR